MVIDMAPPLQDSILLTMVLPQPILYALVSEELTNEQAIKFDSLAVDKA